MKIQLQALCDLFKRYVTIFQEVWASRKQLDGLQRYQDENAFLPAHLELIESPVSALPKWTARLISAFLLLSLIWATFGKIDIVAVAPGKITPSGRSKTIQSIETMVVKQVHVRNGETVRKDQLLMELTALGAKADQKKSEEALKIAKLGQLRHRALLNAIQQDHLPSLEEDEESKKIINSNDSLFVQEQQLGVREYKAWQAQKQRLFATIEQKREEQKTTEISINRLSLTKEYENKRLSDLKSLYEKNGVSKHEYLSQEQRFIEVENQLEEQQSKLNELKASLIQVEQQYQEFVESYQRDILTQLRKYNENVNQLIPEVEKAKQRQQFTEIRSPVNGTVQQLQTYTIGGVVTTAQPLMVIVPIEDQLEVEAMISNKDIGFIKKGQEVILKVDAFPYTRYGHITGRVKNISFDAIKDEKLGLVFIATVSMDRNALSVEGEKIPLIAGMTISAEIKTGNRSVMDYLLSPLRTTIDKSLRER
ncbi:hemolysin D [Pasteurellaceae bacterium Orientalotternb1]|nr:hemolysin D [Pasteurellaceae bacterium Orientalotternb1]